MPAKKPTPLTGNKRCLLADIYAPTVPLKKRSRDRRTRVVKFPSDWKPYTEPRKKSTSIGSSMNPDYTKYGDM